MPTEERFKKLSDDTKYLLYMGFLNTALPEEIHEAYQQEHTVRLDPSVKAGLRRAGYTDEQIARYQDDLQKAMEATQ